MFPKKENIYSIFRIARQIRWHALLAVVLLCVPEPSVAQDVSSGEWSYVLPVSAKKAFDTNSSQLISPLLGSSVELRLPDCSGVYSKKQAEMLISSFLSTNQGYTYTVDHEETVGSSTLTIGLLSKDASVFRVSILTQPSEDGSLQIKQFKIERSR